MSSELERQLAELKQGDHLCPIYESSAEQIAGTVAFIKVGLAQGERCLYSAGDCTVEEVIQALVAARVNVTHERQQGALQFLTNRDSYFLSGKFDPQAMIEFLRQAEALALADGFFGLRFAGEMTWALGPEAGCDRLIEYEALLNHYLPNSRTVIICLYDRSRFNPEV